MKVAWSGFGIKTGSHMQPQYYQCSVEQLHQLLDLLKSKKYTLLGPTLRDQVVVYDELQGANDLPKGWMDEQDPGRYRLRRSRDDSYFKYHASPHSWKKYLFPSVEKLWSARQEKGEITGFEEPSMPETKWAFIGVLSCDLQAISVLTKVFDSQLEDYKQFHRRRENVFILAINCINSVNTCFCTSMGSGPRAKEGFDLSLTEVISGERHYFLLTVGSECGAKLCQELKLKQATETDCKEADALIKKNEEGMMRHIDNDHVHDLLAKSHHFHRWNEVAKRCINCTNCTMSCPTCFCTQIEDRVSVDGNQVDRIQTWESCFDLSHSYVHGGSVRESAKSRYRQWLTHKFGTWWDQFGVSGCVGCGRCIAWCPVGIDVTEELSKLKEESDETNVYG